MVNLSKQHPSAYKSLIALNGEATKRSNRPASIPYSASW